MVGEAEVIKVFKLTGARSATVGGCRVKQGKMIRKSTFRLIRGDEVNYNNIIIHHPTFLFDFLSKAEA